MKELRLLRPRCSEQLGVAAYGKEGNVESQDLSEERLAGEEHAVTCQAVHGSSTQRLQWERASKSATMQGCSHP